MIPSRLIFIHGLEGTNQGVKATLLRGLFPTMLTPDFRGSLEERMAALESILGEIGGWTIVGSSFGGLMGALFTAHHPEQVHKQVLLAPALVWPDFANLALATGIATNSQYGNQSLPVDVPTIIYHGNQDEILPLDATRNLAQRVFKNLTFHAVDDNHGLYKTVHEIDWMSVLS